MRKLSDYVRTARQAWWLTAIVTVVVAIYLNDLRDGAAWLSAHMVRLATDTDRTVAEILGRAPHPGLLYVDSPQIYTRERLVNDRFRQGNWLSKELDTTEGKDLEELFGRPSSASSARYKRRVDVGTDPGEQKKPETNGAESSPMKLSVNRLDTFKQALAYRAEVRNELMGTLLDDGHDLEGNTLYRLNFDAVASPWHGLESGSASALFVVKVSHQHERNRKIITENIKEAQDASNEILSEKSAIEEKEDSENRKDETKKLHGPYIDEQIKAQLNDDLELLRELERRLQEFLTRVLKYRLEYFNKIGTLIRVRTHKTASQISGDLIQAPKRWEQWNVRSLLADRATVRAA